MYPLIFYNIIAVFFEYLLLFLKRQFIQALIPIPLAKTYKLHFKVIVCMFYSRPKMFFSFRVLTI